MRQHKWRALRGDLLKMPRPSRPLPVPAIHCHRTPRIFAPLAKPGAAGSESGHEHCEHRSDSVRRVAKDEAKRDAPRHLIDEARWTRERKADEQHGKTGCP